MGLVNKQTKLPAVNSDTTSELTLSRHEYEKLFETLKNSTIRGEDIQMMYKVILKLQNQYINLYDR